MCNIYNFIYTYTYIIQKQISITSHEHTTLLPSLLAPLTESAGVSVFLYLYTIIHIYRGVSERRKRESKRGRERARAEESMCERPAEDRNAAVAAPVLFYTRTHTHTHTRVHTHAHAHTCKHKRTHTHTHPLTHSRSHTYTHTHTHELT